MMRQADGFTLVELLLSVVIIGMLTGMSLPVYESFVRRNDLDQTTQNVAAAMRRAETYARGVHHDSAWGIFVQEPTITLFRGSSFATRDAAFDEIITIPGSITVGGLNEIRFSKLSGAPNTTGGVTLTSSTNDVRTVTINAEGMVAY